MASFLKKLAFSFTFIFLISSCFANQIARTPTVAYNGPIYNVFFHPLIAYPKLAFEVKHDRLEYIDSWFVTENEFKKIIPQLHQRGYILVSPKDLFEEKTDIQGHPIIVRKKLFLPVGKKPLILSLDDYNFYKSMKLHGTIHRFWVDPNNRLATITNLNNHQTLTRYDQEVPQLLESFIAKHPDFSFNHARGIFALTGYNGIFGYHTHLPHASDYAVQLHEAKKVVTKLKEMGWEFGSHSYFHLALEKQDATAFADSEKRWKREIGSLVGNTSYYIFPFGDAWNTNPIRLNYLKSLGYKYFFGVSDSQKVKINDGAVFMYRFPIDGLSLRNRYNGEKFFISSKILDAHRPKRIISQP